MNIEIELKAHVEDKEALKSLLAEKAEYLYAFEKEDTYWFLEKAGSFPPLKLRIRSEKRRLPDGSEESSTFATYKSKEVNDGIEINDEHEFSINSSSPKTAAEFGELLKLMGLKPGASKHKRGWAFCRDGMNVELTEVESLGWFLELEILSDNCLTPNSREETISEGRVRLLDFLAGLRIKKDAIESRFYTEMLADNARLE